MTIFGHAQTNFTLLLVESILVQNQSFLHFLPHVNRLQYTLVFTDDSRISVKSVHMFTCVSHICIVISGDSSKCMRKAKMCIITSVEFSMQTDLALSLVGKSLNYWLKKCSHVYISCVPRYTLNSPGEI